jgi:CubicO group peptidase (beta-lactamase class C family)
MRGPSLPALLFALPVILSEGGSLFLARGSGHPQIADDKVDEYVRQEMSHQHIPAVSIAVIKDGKIVKSAAYGLANVELNVPATVRTEFAIASMTKSITASAVMLLVQDGKLSLDDPVSRYIDSVPDSWRSITIRHLLTHTSGIKDHYSDYPIFPRVKLDRKLEYNDHDYLKSHFDEPLNFKPGEYGAYSGSNFALLGMIISRVTGHPYQEFFRQRIFTPLGMTSTHLLGTDSVIANRAGGYDRSDSTIVTASYTGRTFLEKADVSVMTTADDLAKWIIALSTGKLWTNASVQAMWTPGQLNDGREAVAPLGSAYGYGWIIGRQNGFPAVGHGGTFNIGFTSAMLIFPEQKIGIVVLDNSWSADPNRISRGIAGFFDPALQPPHLKRVEAASHPELVSAALTIVPALFGAQADVASLVTPGLRAHLSAMPRSPAPPPGAPKPLISFISSENISGKTLVRYDATITRMAHLKVEQDGEHFLTLYLTREGKIGDVSAY